MTGGGMLIPAALILFLAIPFLGLSVGAKLSDLQFIIVLSLLMCLGFRIESGIERSFQPSGGKRLASFMIFWLVLWILLGY